MVNINSKNVTDWDKMVCIRLDQTTEYMKNPRAKYNTPEETRAKVRESLDKAREKEILQNAKCLSKSRFTPIY